MVTAWAQLGFRARPDRRTRRGGPDGLAAAAALQRASSLARASGSDPGPGGPSLSGESPSQAA